MNKLLILPLMLCGCDFRPTVRTEKIVIYTNATVVASETAERRVQPEPTDFTTWTNRGPTQLSGVDVFLFENARGKWTFGCKRRDPLMPLDLDIYGERVGDYVMWATKESIFGKSSDKGALNSRQEAIDSFYGMVHPKTTVSEEF